MNRFQKALDSLVDKLEKAARQGNDKQVAKTREAIRRLVEVVEEE